MEGVDELITDDQVAARAIEVKDSGIGNAIISEPNSGASGDNRAVAVSAAEEYRI